MTDDHTLAYAAGYIDGDGCFFLGKSKVKNTNRFKYRTTIFITSINPEIIQWFSDTFRGTCSLNKVQKTEGHRCMSQFAIQGAKAVEFAQMVLPFLVEKKDEAMTLISSFIEGDKDVAINRIRSLKRHYGLIDHSTKEMIQPLIVPTAPTTIDYAYLAGWIDAECCLTLQHYRDKSKPNTLYKIQLICNNTKFPVFPWLISRFGGAVSFVQRAGPGSNMRNQLMWRVSSKQLSGILPNVLPYLKSKREVCNKLIEFYQLTMPNGGDRQSRAFKDAYAEILAQKDRILSEIHVLNQKGTNT